MKFRFKPSVLIFSVVLTPFFANAYSMHKGDSFGFIPSIAVQDAATSALMENITGKNIYLAFTNGLITENKNKKVSQHLCNGKDEVVNTALIGGCSLVESDSFTLLETKHFINKNGEMIEIDVHDPNTIITPRMRVTPKYITEPNPLIKQNNCNDYQINGTPTSCFVFKIAPFVFDNLQQRELVINALENPCAFLTTVEDARKFTNSKYPYISYLGRTGGEARYILDCDTKNPETYSSIVDEKTQSILLIRNKK
nr:hypothetical protein [Pectobacterium carotovorum]